MNGLLHHSPGLEELPRAGIIHRLDKDTSGLLVVARNLISHTRLIDMMQSRTVKRIYDAIVYGVVKNAALTNPLVNLRPLVSSVTN